MATQTTPSTWRSLAETDPDIAAAIRDERHRQNSGLELIASENFVSRAVLEAAGSVLTNKYAEGYPGKRYYGGCEFVDVVERAAIARARALFGAEHAYVQPHSGSDANLVAFWAVLTQRVESPALTRLAAHHVNDLSDADWEALRGQLGNQTVSSSGRCDRVVFQRFLRHAAPPPGNARSPPEGLDLPGWQDCVLGLGRSGRMKKWVMTTRGFGVNVRTSG